MRFIISVILGSMLLFLSACSLVDDVMEMVLGDEAEQQSSDVEQPSADHDGEAEEIDEGVEEDTNEENAVEVDASASDLAKILQRAKEANKAVESLTIHGDTKEEVSTGEIVLDGHIKLTVNAVFDPFVHHYKQEVVSGMDEDAEWYYDGETTYLGSDDGEWLKTNNPAMSIGTDLIYSDGYLDQIAEYEQLFELTEDAEHYIVTFIGTEEQYSEVFHGNISEDLPFSDSIGDTVEELSNSTTGDVTFKFSKDSSLLVELEQNTKMSVEVAGQIMETSTYSTHHYSHNEIDSLEIPEEVISTATELPF